MPLNNTFQTVRQESVPYKARAAKTTQHSLYVNLPEFISA